MGITGRAILAATLSLGMQAAPALAQDAPVTIEQGMAARADWCRESVGTLIVGLDAERGVDFNGDGIADIIDYNGDTECLSTDPADDHGYMECNASGCPLTIYLSGPGGHRSAWRHEIISAWRIERGPRPRIVAYSSLCDMRNSEPISCEMEVQGNGRALTDRTLRSQVSDGSTPPGYPDWTVRRTVDGVVVAGTRAFAAAGGEEATPIYAMTLRCASGAPVLTIAPMNRAITLERTGFQMAGRDATVALTRRPDGSWSGPVSAAAIALLAGSQATIDVTANGRRAASVSLGGSTQAIGTALAGCRAR